MDSSIRDLDYREEAIQELVSQARSGDVDALGKLLSQLRPYLLSVAADHLGCELQGKAGVSDLVQETFVRAQCGIEGFQGDTHEELLAWLRSILINSIFSLKRRYAADKRAVRREVSIHPDTPSRTDSPQIQAVESSPSSVCVRKEDSDSVLRALARLPEHYREVLQLRDWDQMTWEQIGSHIGKTPEAARKLWARALDKLRGQLSD